MGSLAFSPFSYSLQLSPNSKGKLRYFPEKPCMGLQGTAYHTKGSEVLHREDLVPREVAAQSLIPLVKVNLMIISLFGKLLTP